MSRKKFPEFQSLLNELTSKITLVNGARVIFRLSDGQRITSLDDIQAGEEYVVSSNNKLDKKTRYGVLSPVKPRSNMQRSSLGPSREHLANNKSQFTSAYGSPQQNAGQGQHIQHQDQKPLKCTLINNTDRATTGPMFIHPNNTEESFDDLLKSMGAVVGVMDRPTMYRAKSPYTEVDIYAYRQFS